MRQDCKAVQMRVMFGALQGKGADEVLPATALALLENELGTKACAGCWHDVVVRDGPTLTVEIG